ncbi:MAG: DUF4194 domain-containing protein [Luteolibacter sp.]
MSTLPWPKFWSHVAEADRQPLREALADLLRYGVILGDEGSGRDMVRLVRDHLRAEVEEYLSPLGFRLLVLEDPPLIQAQPIPDECDLLGQFTQQETLFALVLWRLYDEALVTSRTKTVLLSANDLWLKWKVIFDRIEPPSLSAMKDSLARLRRKRLIRFTEANDPTKPGDALIEVLPSLTRVIDFAGLEEWQGRASAFQNEGESPSENSPPPSVS